MKKLALLALIGSAIYMFAPPTQDATAAVSSQDRAKLAVPEQLISNSGWEAGKISWEATGSSTFNIDSGSPLYGKKSALWDSSATGEYLRSKSAAVLPAGMKGQTCLLEARYTWSGVLGEVQLQALDQTNAVLASVDLVPSADPRSAQLNFTCPDPGSTQVKWALASTADSVVVKVDAAFIGTGKNTVQVSQTVFAGESYIAATPGCQWDRTSETIGVLSSPAACPGPTIVDSTLGDWQTTDTNQPEQTVNNLPAGKYKATFYFSSAYGGALQGWTAFAITDGTTTCEAVSGDHSNSASGNTIVSCIFTYTDSGNRTFTVHGAGQTGGTVDLNNQIVNYSLKFQLEKYPSSSAEAITLETSGWYASGYIQAATTNAILGGLIPVLSPVNHTDWTLSTYPGSAPMKISCLSADSTGSDCGANQETMGFSVDVPYAGDYEICFDISHYINEGATGVFGEINASWDIVRTANADHTIVLDNYGPSASSGAGTSNSAGTTTQTLIPVRACAVAKLSSAGKQTFHLMRTQAYNGTISTHLLLADVATKRKASITMTALTQQLPTPVFTDLTDSLNAKPENYGGVKNQTVVYGSLGCGPSSTINRNPGSWMVSVGGGTGICQITFAPGVFNNTPWCFCQTQTTAGVDTGCNTVAATVTNTFHDFRVTNSAAALTSGNINVVCIGD